MRMKRRLFGVVLAAVVLIASIAGTSTPAAPVLLGKTQYLGMEVSIYEREVVWHNYLGFWQRRHKEDAALCEDSGVVLWGWREQK